MLFSSLILFRPKRCSQPTGYDQPFAAQQQQAFAQPFFQPAGFGQPHYQQQPQQAPPQMGSMQGMMPVRNMGGQPGGFGGPTGRVW